MKLIFKYMKPYILVILLVFGLVYVQVQTELQLPDYMSNIVSGGIEYGGIDETVPEIIDAETMNRILTLTSQDSKIVQAYTHYSRGEEIRVKNQHLVLENDVYVRTENSDDLSQNMQKALVYLYLCENMGMDYNPDISLDLALSGFTGNLEENYSSLSRLQTASIYKECGLSLTGIQSGYIMEIGLKMLFISAIGVMAQIACTYFTTRVSSRISATMRHDVFEKVQSFSSTEFSHFSTASLITRSGNDIMRIQSLVSQFMGSVLRSPLMGITAVFKVLRFPQISWILLVAIGFIIGMMIILAVCAVPQFEKLQQLNDRINAIMREFLDGMMVIRAFNTEKEEEKKFKNTTDALAKLDRFVSHIMNLAGPCMTVMMNVLTISITWFSAKLIDVDLMGIGDMMAFSQYAINVVMSFMMVTVTFFMIPRSLVSVKRVREVLDMPNSIEDKEICLDIPKENGELVFDDVSFKYPRAEENVLDHISFTAKPKETIAIIGSTGSGKTTLVKLIPRLFDVTEGRILYCGNDIRDYRQKELHDQIGFASQKAVLFSGTIQSNIEFGRSLSQEELDKAIAVSQSTNIINEKEDGILSAITQNGTNVSGGQKQRLSIARALAKNRNIYIFDDSFSALDYQTDKQLRSELNELMHQTNAMVFIVAQRISTIQNADKILVIDSGRLVGEGTHGELMKTCKVYQEIAYSQLSEEELSYAAN